MTEELQNLPLSTLFAGPLIAAIDASVEAQTETLALLREHGYDEDGNLVTVSFGYTTTESDPEGGTRRVAREIEIPLLLFLSLPNLVIHEIEEEFSAKITEVERTEAETDGFEASSAHRFTPLHPRRLRVTPADRETTLDRKTRSTYDLDVRMVAELQNQSVGMDRLERAATTATDDRLDEEGTERLARERREETDGGVRSRTRDAADARGDPAPIAAGADRPPVDPTEYTVSELREALAAVEDVDRLETVLDAERANLDRTTARQVIERRMAELRDASAEASSE